MNRDEQQNYLLNASNVALKSVDGNTYSGKITALSDQFVSLSSNNNLRIYPISSIIWIEPNES